MSRISKATILALLAISFGEAQERQPNIINGLPTDAFPAVGIVGEVGVGGFCTGTLISPTHVLTAAHCAEAILDLGAEDGGTFEVAGRVYRTSRVEIISTYDNRRFTDDVAILVLAEAVTEVAPMDLSPRAPEVGESVTIVGYGAQGTPELGSDGSFGEKRVGTVTVDSVSNTEFSWFFDDPSESNSAPGDSGGPVFMETGDGFLIAGLVSSGTAAAAELGDTSYNMRVDAYEEWITETVLATTNLVVDPPTVDESPIAEPENPIAEPPIVGQPVDEPGAVDDLVTTECPGATDGDATTPAAVVDGEDSPGADEEDETYVANVDTNAEKWQPDRRRHHSRGESRRPGNSYYGNRNHSGSRYRGRSTTRAVNVRRR